MELVNYYSFIIIFFGLGLGLFFKIISAIITSSSQGKNAKSYRATGILFLTIGIIILFIMGIKYLEHIKDSDEKTSLTASGFTIDNFDINLNVNKNNVVNVEEIIDVNFYESGHHGIYRTIPSWLKYTNKDGKTASRYYDIENINVINDGFTTETIDKKEKIKIGSEYITLSTGIKQYKIIYDYDMGEDPYEGYDEFIFHAYGDYWGTNIESGNIKITMPSEVKRENIKVFKDKYRQEEVTSEINCYVNNNVINISFSEDLDLYKSLTIDILLPDGYFTDATNNYGSGSLILCMFIILIMIISFIKWRKNGKDFDKVAETVEFYAPDGFDAAELGYIYKLDSGRKLTIAIIVELASKGYIEIIDSKDIGKGVVINNLEKGKQSIELMTPNEKIVYVNLFISSDTNYINQDTEFYRVFDLVETNVEKTLEEKVYDLKSYKNLSSAAVMFCLNCAYFAVAYGLFEDLNPKYSFIYIVSLCSIVITFILAVLMTRKSEYGEQEIAKIKGFKNYLETAEKDKLNALVEKDPKYFYNILPYAYVLGVSKKWIEKFEDIPLPADNDLTHFDIDTIDNLSFSIHTPSSDSSSSGGGCSSCGGGCSSCGGGGSW